MTNEINFSKIAAAVVADGEQCDEKTVERLYDSVTDEDRAAFSADPVMAERWLFDALINTQPPLELDAA